MILGEHILAFACCIGNEKIISMLIKAGANIQAQDSRGKSKICKFMQFTVQSTEVVIVLKLYTESAITRPNKYTFTSLRLK